MLAAMRNGRRYITGSSRGRSYQVKYEGETEGSRGFVHASHSRSSTRPDLMAVWSSEEGPQRIVRIEIDERIGSFSDSAVS